MNKTLVATIIGTLALVGFAYWYFYGNNPTISNSDYPAVLNTNENSLPTVPSGTTQTNTGQKNPVPSSGNSNLTPPTFPE